MSKARAKPDVPSLLQLLREEVGRQEGKVRFNEVDLVQRISERVRSRIEPARAHSDVRKTVALLSEQARHLGDRVRFRDVGTVQHIGSGVATLSGLPGAATDELVDFPTGVQGLILNLNHTRLDVILLGSDQGIHGGDLVTTSGQRGRVPVGHQLLGRVINPLGQPLDQRGPVRATDSRYLEREAPDIVERSPVNEPLQTGLKIVDVLLPIGRGQRELILGDRQIGKTTLAVDAILNQRDDDVPCVYVAIGQKKSSTLAVIETLRRHGALAYTCVVIASPEDPPALRYLAPYAGCSIAEFFVQEGRDVLIVYDDLTKHADAYRELSLLLRRPPGREAYPGDIFYVHARLLERACKLDKEQGGGSLTALPIVETKQGNVSAYIPTNLISICDGQIVLDTDLFNRGTKPAVNVGQSVSRVGGEAQSPAMRAVAGELQLALAQYEEVSRFARFGTEVDEATQYQIQRGRRLRTVLTQPAHQPLPLAAQVAMLLAATEGYLDDVLPENVPAFESGLLAHFKTAHPEIALQINRTGELSAETRGVLIEMIANYHTAWLEGRAPSGTEGSGPEGNRI